MDTKLTGKALLAKVKELSHLSKRDTAIECGYALVNADTGKTRVNLAEFYDAVLAAKGVELDAAPSIKRGGKQPSYRAVVHENGQIVIGSIYTTAMGLEPGDALIIKPGSKQLRLVREAVAA
jgi:hypothetical protein